MSAVTADSELDLTKHVNFTAGMILGVTDFKKEFGYLAGRDRWLARDAIGYGTVSGLGVRIEKDAKKGHRVMIQPGVAISPRGQLICVPAAQCAYLNEWLAAAKAADLHKWIRTEHDIVSPPVSPSPVNKELRLYVVLCYRDCLTDEMPIPGEPCRDESELMAPSSVKDDFTLELRFEPPKQPEEAAVRRYVAWLKKIEVTGGGSSTPINDFLKAIRHEFLPQSPPVSLPALHLRADDVCEYMRAAFRLWVTELRNVLSERKTGCAVEMTGAESIDDCVLLAELRVSLNSLSPGWKVSDTRESEVNEAERPFLLHLRMLQELMLCAGMAETPAPVSSPHLPANHNHTLNSLGDVTAPLPAEGQILIFRKGSGKWIAEAPAVINHAGAAGGDLEGTYPNPVVDGLQGNPVSAQKPKPGDILTWNGTNWIPAQPQQQAAQIPLLLPLATIDLLQPAWFFDIWFNLDAPGNAAEIKDLNVEHVTARMELEKETNPATPFLEAAKIVELKRLSRNLFRIRLGEHKPKEISKLRFDFNTKLINVASGDSVLKFARDNNIRFLGESKNNVTIFVRVPGTLDKE
jgi:hypothetical protein